MGLTKSLHSKRCDSFLGSGSVQPRQSILRENDKYIKCRGDSELFKYTQRGGKRAGAEVSGGSPTYEINSKNGKNSQFLLWGCEYERGCKGGATFQHVSSDHLYHDRRL